MTFIKKVINSDSGTADLVGGNQWDLLDDVFDGIATGLTAKIATNFQFGDDRLFVFNPAGTFTYRISTSAIGANRILTLPLLTGDAIFALDNWANIFLQNQTISWDGGDAVPQLTIRRPVSTVGQSAGGLEFHALNASAANVPYAFIFGEIVANTAGSQSGAIQMYIKRAGSSKQVFRINENGLVQLGGDNKRIQFADTSLTAARTYTFPDVTSRVAVEAFENVFTKRQHIQVTAADYDALDLQLTDNPGVTYNGPFIRARSKDSSGALVNLGYFGLNASDVTPGAMHAAFEVQDYHAGVGREVFYAAWNEGTWIEGEPDNVLHIFRRPSGGNLAIGSAINILFDGLNGSGIGKTWAWLYATPQDVSNGSEDASFSIDTVSSGVGENIVYVSGGEHSFRTAAGAWAIWSTDNLSVDRVFTLPDITTMVAGYANAGIFTKSQTIETDVNVEDQLVLRQKTNVVNDYAVMSAEIKNASSNYFGAGWLDWFLANNTAGAESTGFEITVRNAGTWITPFTINNDGTVGLGGVNRRIKFAETGLTATRTFTFPDATTLLAGQNFANVFTSIQKINLNASPQFTYYRPFTTTFSIWGPEFTANDSGAVETQYARIGAQIVSSTDPTEKGAFVVDVRKSGTMTNMLYIDETGFYLGQTGSSNIKFLNSGLTADRTITFQDSSYKVAAVDLNNNFTEKQTIKKNQSVLESLYRLSNTATDQVILEFNLQDSLSNETVYSAIRGEIVTNTDASESGKLLIYTTSAGSNRCVAQFDATGQLWCGGPNQRVAFDETGLTARRTITFQDANTKVAGLDNTQTFSLTNTFTKSIVANGGLNVTHVSKTANYTLTADDGIIRADASGGAFTLTLPAAGSNTKKIYTIIRTDIVASTNLLTIDGNASETIDGNLTYTLTPGESVEILCDGSNWIVLNRTDVSAESGSYLLKNSTNNRRYVAGLNAGNNALLTSTTSPAANTLWAMPFYVSKVTKFDTISFEVTTLVAAKNARCGIYSDNGNCYPGKLIFDTGSVSVATTGVKDTTITSSLQILQPGLYWLTWETDAGATLMIRILPGAGTCIPFAGLANTMGTTGGGFAYSVAHTYGALPDPYTASATIITTPSAVGSPIPAVALRPI